MNQQKQRESVVMRMNESAETKGECCHEKGISLKMSKDRGI